MDTVDAKNELNDSLSRRERKKQVARDNLLQAGRKEFYEKGFARASIPDIAKLADVGVGTFYLHFDSKETLFKEIINDGFQQLEREFMGARIQFEGQEEFSMAPFIRSFYRFAWANRELFAMMFGSSELAWGVIREWRKRFAKRIEGMIPIVAKRRGVSFQNRTDALLASAIIATLTNTGLWWMNLLEPGEVTFSEFDEMPSGFDEVVRVLDDFIIGGINAVLMDAVSEERGR